MYQRDPTISKELRTIKAQLASHRNSQPPLSVMPIRLDKEYTCDTSELTQEAVLTIKQDFSQFDSVEIYIVGIESDEKFRTRAKIHAKELAEWKTKFAELQKTVNDLEQKLQQSEQAQTDIIEYTRLQEKLKSQGLI